MTIILKDLAFVIFKPDTVKQNLERSLWCFFQKHGISLVAQKEGIITKEKRKMLYIDFHLNSRSNWDMGTRFFELGPALFLIVHKKMEKASLSEFITEQLKGNFVPVLSKPETIRGEFNAINPVFNLIHTSDSIKDTLREVQIFFEREELKLLLQERLTCKNLDLTHKDSVIENTLSFEALFYNIKRQLVERFVDNVERRKGYVNILEDNLSKLKNTKNRKNRKELLFEFLDLESKNLLINNDHPLLITLTNHFQFVELDYKLLSIQLQSAGVVLDKWENYLLETSMYYIHFL
ncbi:hypothetical protein PTI45_04624 [Paenibacillus nuruki]|uniref:nucleoside-diphosphate kinase n=1 Tax=Paenibacillus nuruki TaxID=1886670 RepID=A0A1E3KWW9_9BACL|nr:nucleoside-diphosphate kinase [Paenibacillus nuruki]ODP26038.1 hypothetical protein PTI45_04624 [Paenibacillus nuruki]